MMVVVAVVVAVDAEDSIVMVAEVVVVAEGVSVGAVAEEASAVVVAGLLSKGKELHSRRCRLRKTAFASGQEMSRLRAVAFVGRSRGLEISLCFEITYFIILLFQCVRWLFGFA